MLVAPFIFILMKGNNIEVDLYVYKNPINAGLFVNLQYNLKEKFSIMIDFKKFNSVIFLTSYFASDEKCKQAIIDEAVYRWSTRKMGESF